jgi:hypothetical protein
MWRLSARTTKQRMGWHWPGTCRTSFLCVAAFCCPSSVCFKNARSTDTIILVSRVSRNTIKKTKEGLSVRLRHCFGHRPAYLGRKTRSPSWRRNSDRELAGRAAVHTGSLEESLAVKCLGGTQSREINCVQRPRRPHQIWVGRQDLISVGGTCVRAKDLARLRQERGVLGRRRLGTENWELGLRAGSGGANPARSCCDIGTRAPRDEQPRRGGDAPSAAHQLTTRLSTRRSSGVEVASLGTRVRALAAKPQRVI